MEGELVRLREDGVQLLGAGYDVDLVALARRPASRRRVAGDRARRAVDEGDELLLVVGEDRLHKTNHQVRRVAQPRYNCSVLALFTRTIVKFLGSVETAVHETVFCPEVAQPVALVGAVTETARAEAAKARTAAKLRMVYERL